MIIKFVCDNTECVNVGIEYRMEDSELSANCGGCWASLTGTPEEQ